MIYEAILFISLFGTMYIISYFVSKKQAEIYENEHPVQERKDAVRKEKLVDMYLNSSFIKIKGKCTVLLELSDLLNKKTINKDEFNILKKSLNANCD